MKIRLPKIRPPSISRGGKAAFIAIPVLAALAYMGYVNCTNNPQSEPTPNNSRSGVVDSAYESQSDSSTPNWGDVARSLASTLTPTPICALIQKYSVPQRDLNGNPLRDPLGRVIFDLYSGCFFGFPEWIHVVKEGDTIYKIGRARGYREDQLRDFTAHVLAANPGLDPLYLHPGDKIVVGGW
jgi:hypothetical protein